MLLEIGCQVVYSPSSWQTKYGEVVELLGARARVRWSRSVSKNGNVRPDGKRTWVAVNRLALVPISPLTGAQ